MAIAALVCGIAAWATCPLVGIVALALGARARTQIRESGGAEEGDGMALAGMIIGGVALVVIGLGAVVAIIAVTLLGHPANTTTSLGLLAR